MDNHSQLTHPQNMHKRPKRLGHHNATRPTPLTPRNDVLSRQVFVSGEEELESATANTGMHACTQAQVRNASHSQFPHTAVQADLSEPVVAPVAMHLQGAHISGNTRLTNVRGDYVTSTVNNYGETNGLKELKKFVSFEAQFDSSAQDPNRQCHPGTRKNVLKRLRDWVDNPNSTERIFWLHGPAGAGKSAIAQTIAHSYARPKVAASFFFFKSDVNRNDGNRLFTTLAYQLALSMPEIRDYIVNSLSERPDLPWTNPETQFEQLLVRPFQVLSEDASQQLAPAVYPIIGIVKKYQQLAPVIIIDGVDECTNDDLQRRFLQVIGDAVGDQCFPLRFLIVSRPELHIEQTVRRFQPPTLTIDLAKLDDANRDIKKYLVDGFSRIASEQDLDPAWPGQEIIDTIVYKSSGNFIFPSLVIRFV
ncbi:hypothetical protein JOM56_012401, partial [Amanita muscaria]